MKNDIKQKLELFDKYTASEQTDPPASLDERLSALRVPSPKERAKKRTRFWIAAGSAVAAAAITVAIALPVYFISKSPADRIDGALSSPDPDKNSAGTVAPDIVPELPASYADILEAYQIMLPAKPYSSVTAHTANKNDICCYVHISYNYGNERLEVYAAFDNEYEIDGQSNYEAATKQGSTADITYNYEIYPALNYSLAAFKFADVRYYISYYSPAPDGITAALESFILQ